MHDFSVNRLTLYSDVSSRMPHIMCSPQIILAAITYTTSKHTCCKIDFGHFIYISSLFINRCTTILPCLTICIHEMKDCCIHARYCDTWAVSGHKWMNIWRDGTDTWTQCFQGTFFCFLNHLQTLVQEDNMKNQQMFPSCGTSQYFACTSRTWLRRVMAKTLFHKVRNAIKAMFDTVFNTVLKGFKVFFLNVFFVKYLSCIHEINKCRQCLMKLSRH